MSDGRSIRPAQPSDAGRIASVLTAAFLDDPGAIIFEPDRERRAAILPAFFGAWVRAAIADGGDLVVPDGEVTGVATWFGPERHGPSEAAMEAGDHVVIYQGADLPSGVYYITLRTGSGSRTQSMQVVR
jgi:hypothetical protein